MSSVSAIPSNAAAPSSPFPNIESLQGVGSMRVALSKFAVVLTIAIAVASLAFVEGLLTAVGAVPGTLTAAPGPVNEWWNWGVGVALLVGFGLAMGILVIIGIVVAVQGIGPWRRGLIASVAGLRAYGAPYSEPATRAREDHSITLWLFLFYVLAAIVMSAAVALVDLGVRFTSGSPLPGSVTSSAVGFATGAVLVAIYYYGARHIAGALEPISSERGRALLQEGRLFLLLSPLVGLVAATFNPFSWAFESVTIASLVLALLGARRLEEAYDLWLGTYRTAPVGDYRPAAAFG